MKYRDLEITFQLEDIPFNTISIALEKLDKPMPMHSHSKNSFEIHYVSFGFGKLISYGKTYEITPGTLFVTGPEIEHEQISVPDNPMTEYCIYVKVAPSKNISSTKRGSKKKAGENAPQSLVNTFLDHPFWFGTADNTYHELMKQIIAELDEKPSGYELMLKSLLPQVILYLIRKYQESEASVSPKSEKKESINDLTYLIIEEAFLYDYRDVTLEDLASRVNLGVRQTERLLKLHYNKTFQQKKTEARMSAACSLLRDSNHSISSIALSLGYSSVEHFSNAFKKHFGTTPSIYRANVRS